MPMPNIDLSNLSAAELDDLIARAAKRRQALQPPVALEPPQTSEATIDPAWRSLMHGANTVLQLRHLGYPSGTHGFPSHECSWFGFIGIICKMSNFNEQL
jgi:hypothetical protein